jgi:hypothetical protein
MFLTLASDLNRTEKELIKTFCVSIKRKKDANHCQNGARFRRRTLLLGEERQKKKK